MRQYLLLLYLCSAVSAYGQTLPKDFRNLSTDVQAVILEYVFFSEQANQIWGQDYEAPTPYTLVKYLDDYHTKTRIDFANGRIRIENQGSQTPKASLEHAIVATLLTPADPNAVDLYTAADMGLTGRPFLAGQVQDHEGHTILYPWRAQRYAQWLITHRLQQRGGRYWVEIPMVAHYKQVGAEQYRRYAQQSSTRHRVPIHLIMAIMEAESSFNPFAVSHANAYGLMQIMQRTAGLDVNQRIHGRSVPPTRDYLFQPKNNIDMGTAYLAILRDVYLRDIRHPLAREYSVIAAYNGGAGNLLKTFHQDRQRAIARINAMSPQQVYNTIVASHPKLESRRYLQKVTDFQHNYRHW
ncbi:MAG: DUF3393 domain-containing protein [Bacterioplanes sp.]|nr:DUF3393 domain-containing protein [Bacterioplanes sp.]